LRIMASANSEKTYSIDLFAASSTKEITSAALTKNELVQIKRGDKKRKDGRKLDEFRPMCINADTSAKADGSAYAELGNTKLYCTVNGPHEVNRADTNADTSWRALLTAKVIYTPFAFRSRLQRQRGDQETAEERAYAAALTDAFTPLILLDKYPRSQIDLLITVIEDDGGVLPLALTTCAVALTNAGIQIYDLIVAASMVAIDDHFIIDPTLEERNCPISTHISDNKDPSNGFVEKAQITLGLMPSLNQVVCVNQEGQVKPKNFCQALKALEESCYRQYPIVQQAITKSIRRDRKIIEAQKANQ